MSHLGIATSLLRRIIKSPALKMNAYRLHADIVDFSKEFYRKYPKERQKQLKTIGMKYFQKWK